MLTTRALIVWAVSYAYLAYIFVGQLPGLKGTLPFSVNVESALLIMLYLFHSYVSIGPRTATKFLVVATVVSYLFEFVGVETGIPFGEYTYTNALGPFLGPVPLFIPFLWACLGYFCMLATDNYIVSAVMMVLLDVSFDPRYSRTLWHWSVPGEFFGVPLSNFAGWFVVALSLYGLFYIISKQKPAPSLRGILFYFLLGTYQAVSDFNAGLPELAVISLALFTLAWVRLWIAELSSPDDLLHQRK